MRLGPNLMAGLGPKESQENVPQKKYETQIEDTDMLCSYTVFDMILTMFLFVCHIINASSKIIKLELQDHEGPA